jgi:K+-sensing histidine kinase KdpD
MRKRKTKLYDCLIIGLFLLSVLINVVVYHYCAGINNNAVFVSISLLCFAILIIAFETRLHSEKVIYSISIVLLITVSIVTSISFPKYSYQQAKELIRYDLSEQYKDVEVLDNEIKTIKSVPKLNFLINKMYLVKVNHQEENIIYYFNPLTGDYGITDI